jgi:hypothetical protein
MNRKYYIPDYETGYRYEVSKEQYDAYLRMWEYAAPKVNGLVGTVSIFGTSGDFDSDGLESIFYGSE